MTDDQLFPVPRQVAQSAWVNEPKYFKMYEDSIKNPDKFWGEAAKRVDWIKPFSKVRNSSFTGNVSIKWYEDGTLNA
ncbi:MAG TPA: acetyl-coenzyme A synthetase N-terminal domain-containing protein, partial [Stellaceae bacterium]|nr:acetyl-coenzyme A synthetase N-terminal domain-containing protein [Stellaceae bacterium]